MSARLRSAVEHFDTVLRPILGELADRAGTRGGTGPLLRREAADLVGAVFAADGRITDAEIAAASSLPAIFTEHAGGPDAGPSGTTRLRAALLAGGSRWLEAPSPMVGLLVDADADADGGGDGGGRAAAYRDAAVALAYAAVAVDGYAGRVELRQVEAFRAMLDRLVVRPGAGQAADGRTDGRDPRGGGDGGGGHARVATVEAPPIDETDLDGLLAELDALIGLEPVKAQVRQVADLLTVARMRTDHGLPVVDHGLHLVFTGNPGTGKTTVARLLARIYRALGALERGQLVETDRAGLVAGYVGQTATRVLEAVDAADGGLLLIDEAYALVRGGPTDFGREAIDTLVKLLEDRRDRLAVVVTGYPDEMTRFLSANPGLRSRFPRTIHFPDYSDGELLAIFDLLAGRHSYRLTRGARRQLAARVAALPRGSGFGNGRVARNLFEEAVARQAGRLARAGREPDAADLQRLTAADTAPSQPRAAH